MSAPHQQPAPAGERTLFYTGSNLGLGFPVDECYFSIEENGERADWTIAEVLARIGEFFEAAKARIASDLEFQAKYGGLE